MQQGIKAWVTFKKKNHDSFYVRKEWPWVTVP